MPGTTTIEDIDTLVKSREDAAYARGREDALAEIRGIVNGGTKPAPKPKAKPASKPKPKPKSKAKKNPWADLTPAARLKRVNAIRVGRGLPPRKSLDD